MRLAFSSREGLCQTSPPVPHTMMQTMEMDIQEYRNFKGRQVVDSRYLGSQH